MSRGTLIVLSGPSGVGKSTVVNHIKQQDVPLWVSVSMTTREQRPQEEHGVSYFFVDRNEFEQTIAQGDMLEWAEFAGNLYGTPAGPVEEKLASGVHVLLEIELQGARQVRSRFPEALLVFLKPPSWDVLVERLTGRGTEAPEVIARRLEVAKVELAAESEFDTALTNSDVEQTAQALLDFACFRP
jgi:guanylate kinase